MTPFDTWWDDLYNIRGLESGKTSTGDTKPCPICGSWTLQFWEFAWSAGKGRRNAMLWFARCSACAAASLRPVAAVGFFAAKRKTEAIKAVISQVRKKDEIRSKLIVSRLMGKRPGSHARVLWLSRVKS